jgi:hypothetical protein
MMMKFLVGLTVASVLLCLTGCGSSEYKPVKQAIKVKEYKLDPNNYANLFPFTEGNRWTYALESSAQVQGQPNTETVAEFEYRVKQVIKESPTATRAILEVYRDTELREEQEWMVDATGLYQMSLGKDRRAFSPKQLVLKFPIKEGETSSWEGSGPTPLAKPGTMKYQFKVDKIQPIDTDVQGEALSGLFVENAGTFKADGQEGILAQNTWYVPGVGLARYKQVLKLKGVEAVLTLRLKSYTVK